MVVTRAFHMRPGSSSPRGCFRQRQATSTASIWMNRRSGSTRRHRSPLRHVLRLGLFFFTKFSRWLECVSPRANDLLTQTIETAAAFQRQIGIARRQVITMRVGETRFRLCLVGGHETAYSDYVPLARAGKVYEPLATACLTRLLRRLPDPTFMDVGAFMGYFTCYAAALLKDQRSVFAVESNPVFCQAIERAVALNGFTRVRVMEAALSDRSETVTINDTAVLPGNEPARAGRTVQAVTMDDLCYREKITPTIIKIDVHGAEGKVLRGMSRLLRDTIQVVLLELHPVSSYRSHSPNVTRLELLSWLEQFGFTVFHVSGHRMEWHSGVAAYLEQGRFAYVRVTSQSQPFLLFDRPLDVLILATKASEPTELLGPSVDLATAVG
jgi:FkbM family methyltransferase